MSFEKAICEDMVPVWGSSGTCVGRDGHLVLFLTAAKANQTRIWEAGSRKDYQEAGGNVADASSVFHMVVLSNTHAKASQIAP